MPKRYQQVFCHVTQEIFIGPSKCTSSVWDFNWERRGLERAAGSWRCPPSQIHLIRLASTGIDVLAAKVAGILCLLLL